MNKVELEAKVMETTGVDKKTVGKVVDALFDAITNSLAAGDDVRLIGFGTFKVNETAARKGVNPSTGQAIEIAATKRPVFKAGKGLKDAIKG